jgi:hypothetical protein
MGQPLVDGGNEEGPGETCNFKVKTWEENRGGWGNFRSERTGYVYMANNSINIQLGERPRHCCRLGQFSASIHNDEILSV